ncbi:TRAF-like family protein [Euphorbia peplus]|nr:TRAF-like family protein [Euphorbia peplus]
MGSVQKVKRDFPPKHFSLRIESFSIIADATSDKYESVIFPAEGYSWRLNLYPKGNLKGGGKDHISLYLEIVNLPQDEDVHVEFKFFMFNQRFNYYRMMQDTTTKRFHEMKTEWGYDQLESWDYFKDATNGYLVNDCCEFGVEIFLVTSKTPKQQTLTIVKPSTYLLPFKRTFTGFSKMQNPFYYSQPPMDFGGQSWQIRFDPKGYGKEEGNSLSVFLMLVDGGKLPDDEKVWAEFKLRVLDQRQNNHVEHIVRKWYHKGCYVMGLNQFMPLGDMHQANKGFVLNDNVIVEVEFVNVSVTKIFNS